MRAATSRVSLAGRQQAEEFLLALAEPGRAAEQAQPFGGGGRLDRDGDVALGPPGPPPGGPPGGSPTSPRPGGRGPSEGCGRRPPPRPGVARRRCTRRPERAGRRRPAGRAAAAGHGCPASGGRPRGPATAGAPSARPGAGPARVRRRRSAPGPARSAVVTGGTSACRTAASAASKVAPARPPQLQEGPAAVRVAEDHRRDVGDVVAASSSRQTRLRDRSPCVASANRATGGSVSVVHRFSAREVPQPDQPGQLGEGRARRPAEPSRPTSRDR